MGNNKVYAPLAGNIGGQFIINLVARITTHKKMQLINSHCLFSSSENKYIVLTGFN